LGVSTFGYFLAGVFFLPFSLLEDFFPFTLLSFAPLTPFLSEPFFLSVF